MNTLIILGFALLCLFSWAVSVAIAFWDIFRRRIPDGEKIAWLALVGLLPFAGFLAYWAARGVEWLQADSDRSPAAAGERMTLERPEPEVWSPTIPASDLDRSEWSEWLEAPPAAPIQEGETVRGAEVFEVPEVEVPLSEALLAGADAVAAPQPEIETELEPDPDPLEAEAVAEAEYQPTLAAPPVELIMPEAAEAQESITRLVLTAAQGPYSGAEFVLQEFPAVLGRGPRAGVRLDDDLSVSRRHAEITVRDGRPWIGDLESVHGTFVNGQQVSDHRLKIGDRIQVGMTVLLFVHAERGTIQNVDTA